MAQKRTEIKIEKGIPLPSGPRNGNGNRKYPFDEMEIGDSFLVKGIKSSMWVNARNASLRTGFKFKVAKVGDGVRVWRVE